MATHRTQTASSAPRTARPLDAAAASAIVVVLAVAAIVGVLLSGGGTSDPTTTGLEPVVMVGGYLEPPLSAQR